MSKIFDLFLYWTGKAYEAKLETIKQMYNLEETRN
jgi:hypothetical protein